MRMEPFPVVYRPHGRWRGPVYWCVAEDPKIRTHGFTSDHVQLELTVVANWQKTRYMWLAKRRAKAAVRRLRKET